MSDLTPGFEPDFEPDIPPEPSPSALQTVASTALQAAMESLRQTELARSAAEALPDGLLAINAAGSIKLVNVRLEFMFGYPRGKLLEQKVEMLLPEEYRERHIQYRSEFFKDPSVREMGQRRVLEGLHMDGSRFRVFIRLAPVVTSEGIFAIATIRRSSDAS